MPDFKSKISKSLSYWQAGSAYAVDFPEITLKNAQFFPEALTRFEKKFGQTSCIHLSKYFKKSNSDKIGSIFAKYGSDKSTSHDYHLPYSFIVLNLEETSNVRVLEVGIGTNQDGFISTMGVNGKPGASLRAWREIFPKGQIFGADLDESALFKEDKIETYRVDQLDTDSFNSLFAACGSKNFDLIIDDGLHSPLANLNTLEFGLSKVNVGGWVVVEDILPRHIHTLLPIERVLFSNKNFVSYIVQCKKTYLYLVNRIA